jgi:DoxX-like family
MRAHVLGDWKQMRKLKTIYWIITGIASAIMLMSSIPDVFLIPGAVEIFRHLGFPTYLLPFIGLAKIAGVIVILLPIFETLKEWAYAGLVFDLVGAFYSHLSVGDRIGSWIFAVFALVFVGSSYALYRAKIANGEVEHLTNYSTAIRARE